MNWLRICVHMMCFLCVHIHIFVVMTCPYTYFCRTVEESHYKIIVRFLRINNTGQETYVQLGLSTEIDLLSVLHKHYYWKIEYRYTTGSWENFVGANGTFGEQFQYRLQLPTFKGKVVAQTTRAAMRNMIHSIVCRPRTHTLVFFVC